MKPLKPDMRGTILWSANGQDIARLRFKIIGNDKPVAVQLSYFVNVEEIKYSIGLETTYSQSGNPSYCFLCPLTCEGHTCGRRVRILYLPSGAMYFGCRQCHNLTYRSSQEERRRQINSSYLTYLVHNKHPRIKDIEIGSILNGEDFQPSNSQDQKIKDYLGEPPVQKKIDKFARYMSITELCELTKLDPIEITRLESAHLLLPDHDRKYRPKLAGWARKLAFLLASGWEIDEIKAWAKGRWMTDNPRLWPPNRSDW